MEISKTPVCCGLFEENIKFFDWMVLCDEKGDRIENIYCLPHRTMFNKEGKKHKYKVKYCPMCGQDIRDIKLSETDFKALS